MMQNYLKLGKNVQPPQKGECCVKGGGRTASRSSKLAEFLNGGADATGLMISRLTLFGIT